MNTYRRPKGNPTRYVPAGSEAVTREGIEATVYIYTSPRGQPCALFYGGKRSKPDRHFAYRTQARRSEDIESYFVSLAAWAENKASLAAERKAYQHSFKPGDIFSYTWGYDQTNVEFYQVTATTEKTVTVREIASKPVPDSGGFMCDHCIPCPDAFLSDAPEIVKHPQPSGDGSGLLPFEFGNGQPWDGKPEYRSWYA